MGRQIKEKQKKSNKNKCYNQNKSIIHWEKSIILYFNETL